MSGSLVDVEFGAMLRSQVVEQIARARIDAMAGQYPAVQHWRVRLEQPRMINPARPAFGAQVHAELADGGIACAHSSGPELLAALEMALDAVRVHLTDEDITASRLLAWRTRPRTRTPAERLVRADASVGPGAARP